MRKDTSQKSWQMREIGYFGWLLEVAAAYADNFNENSDNYVLVFRIFSPPVFYFPLQCVYVALFHSVRSSFISARLFLEHMSVCTLFSNIDMIFKRRGSRLARCTNICSAGHGTEQSAALKLSSSFPNADTANIYIRHDCKCWNLCIARMLSFV